MIFARTNTYGVDSKIYLIQQYLQNNLPWFSDNGGNLNDYQIRIYGQMYPNTKRDKIRPENYLDGNSKDYAMRLNSDKSVVQIAFYVTDTTISLGQNIATIDIIFTVNVNEIYDNKLWLTEKCMLDAQKIVERCGFIGLDGEGITDIKTRVTNVFADFDTEKIKYNDYAPKWVFSFETQVFYINDSCKAIVPSGTLFTADNNTITVDNNEITIDQIII